MIKRIIAAYRRCPQAWNQEIIAWILSIGSMLFGLGMLEQGISDGRILIGFIVLAVWAIVITIRDNIMR